jgi:hypothetical protein
MADGTTWEDVLGDHPPLTAAPKATTTQQKASRSETVGWDDLLSATPPAQPSPGNATKPAPIYSQSQPAMNELERLAGQQEANQYLIDAGTRAGQQDTTNQILHPPTTLEEMGTRYGTPPGATVGKPQPPTYGQHLAGVVGPDTVLGRILRRAVGRTDVAPPDLVSNAAALPIVGQHIIKPLAERAGLTVGEPEPLVRFSPMPGSIADFPEARGVTRFATSMTEPENLALMGAIGKLTGIPAAAVQTYFAGQMGAGAIQNLSEINDALKRHDIKAARELAVEAGLNTWFAAESGRGAVEGGRSIAAGRRAQGPSSGIAPQPEKGPAFGEGEPAAQIPQPTQPRAGIPSGRDVSWEDLLRRPVQAAPQEAATQPGPQLTHPAGEVTGIDEASGLPIVRRAAAEVPTARESKVASYIEKLFQDRGRSEAVRSRIEDLADNGTDPRPLMQEFWDKTFPALDQKGKANFLRQFKFQMGTQPGDTLSTGPGGNVVAKDWRDITDTFFADAKNVDDLEQNEQAIAGLADILSEMRRKSESQATQADGTTQPLRTSVSTARQPVALRSQQETPGEYGGEAVVKTPTSDLPAKYKLVEAADLTPSHNAETFAPNPGYPPAVQERAYHTSKEAQARVIQQAQNYDPRYTVNTNPDAVNGPPIVTPDGTVLGGNSRTMSTQRLYARGQGDTYRDYLRTNAQQFGLTPEAVDKMQKPVLVREIPAPGDIEAARRLGSELNKNMTGALGTSERAVSAGKSITPASLSQISGMLDNLGPDSSIRDLLRDRGRDVLSLLTRDGAITERERPQFIDTATGGLSEEGKQFAERALLGTVVDEPTLMERTPKSILNKLDGSLADISSIAPRTDEYNLLPLVREAIAEHADIAARGLDVESHLAQSSMFGPERNPAVDAIVRKLAEKPKAVREAFRSFARDANADKEGQGFLAIVEQPSAAAAFNEAFGTKLTDSQFEQSVLQSLERETRKGRDYEKSIQQEAISPDASLRGQPAEGTSGRAEARTGPDQSGTGAEAPALLPPETDGPVGGTLFAHTPFSAGKLALDRLNRFYGERVAEPLIQKVLKTGRTHPEVENADPELADNLRLLDNAPKYFRQKAQAVICGVTAGLSRGQERLFTLMADADSRENLIENHPDEYVQARKDPAILAALKRYRPEEQQLTEARKALGGEVIDDDYLRRVYDKYTSGINKRETSGKSLTAYDRVIRPQRADRFSREAESEYHYQKGLHEFGPAFGTKYVATMIKVARNRVALEFLSKATPIEHGDYLPREIDYNGKTYYAPEVARDMREGGKRGVETYGTYSPQANGTRFLGPQSITEALNGLDAPGAKDPSGIKRFFQEQTVGLGFGVPHMFNILRRVTQSAPGGAVNPVGWARALRVAFSSELKARGISGVNDPTFDRLAKFGAIASDSEVSSFKKYIGGNLNPANWIRPFSKIGHDVLFKPGALDQRARLYIADLVKSQHPEFTDSRIAQAVNEQLGNYNRANWTKMQTKMARFVLFPGWDMSSLNWVIRHPIKTSVPPALLIWAANQTINAMTGNRESDKNDFFAIHAGNRAFSTGLIREPLGRAFGGAPLRFAQALVEGKSPSRATTEASRGLASDITHPLGMLRPDLGATIELGTNRERIGGSKEITKSSDFSTPGWLLPNAGLDKLAWHAVTRLVPQLGRVAQATDEGGKFDFPQALGGNLGIYNYRVDAQDRLRKKMAVASDYEQSKTAVLQKNPQAIKDLFAKDPDAAVYLAFRSSMQQSLGTLKKIDQAKDMISSSSETPERKKAALAALGKAREQELVNADKVDRAVDLVLKRVHQLHGSVLPNIPFLRLLRQQGSQPSEPQP